MADFDNFDPKKMEKEFQRYELPITFNKKITKKVSQKVSGTYVSTDLDIYLFDVDTPSAYKMEFLQHMNGTVYSVNLYYRDETYTGLSLDSSTYRSLAQYLKTRPAFKNLPEKPRTQKVANNKVEQEIDKELNDLWNRREYKS